MHVFSKNGVIYSIQLVDTGVVAGGLAPLTSSLWHVTVGDDTRPMRPARLEDEDMLALEDEVIAFVASWA